MNFARPQAGELKRTNSVRGKEGTKTERTKKAWQFASPVVSAVRYLGAIRLKLKSAIVRTIFIRPSGCKRYVCFVSPV